MLYALALFFGLYVSFFLFVFGVAELLERGSSR